MATQTLVATANSPAINTRVWGAYVLAFRAIGTVTSWTVKVEAWTGANGGGTRQTCGVLTAFQHNWTTGADPNSFSGNNINTATATTSAALTANDAYAGQGLWNTSGSPGSLIITLTYDDSFGRLIPLRMLSGVWSIGVSATAGGVRRGGAWSPAGDSARVRRGGVWVG